MWECSGILLYLAVEEMNAQRACGHECVTGCPNTRETTCLNKRIPGGWVCSFYKRTIYKSRMRHRGTTRDSLVN